MAVGGPPPILGDSKLGQENKGHQLLMKMGLFVYLIADGLIKYLPFDTTVK